MLFKLFFVWKLLNWFLLTIFYGFYILKIQKILKNIILMYFKKIIIIFAYMYVFLHTSRPYKPHLIVKQASTITMTDWIGH
jgi:hypothetical protein